MALGGVVTPLIGGMRVIEPLITLAHDWGAVMTTTLVPEAQEVTGFGLARGGIDRGILIYGMGESQVSSVLPAAATSYHVQLHVNPDAPAPPTPLAMAQDSRVLLEYGFDQNVDGGPISIDQMNVAPPEAMLLVANPSLIIVEIFAATPTNPVVRFWYKWVELERAVFNALVRR